MKNGPLWFAQLVGNEVYSVVPLIFPLKDFTTTTENKTKKQTNRKQNKQKKSENTTSLVRVFFPYTFFFFVKRNRCDKL